RPPSPPISSLKHHSRTLPAMSTVPKRLRPPRPTGIGPFPPRLLAATIHRAPYDPEARYQCRVVGNSRFSNAARAAASYQLIPPTGKSASPRRYLLSSQVL